MLTSVMVWDSNLWAWVVCEKELSNSKQLEGRRVCSPCNRYPAFRRQEAASPQLLQWASEKQQLSEEL